VRRITTTNVAWQINLLLAVALLALIVVPTIHIHSLVTVWTIAGLVAAGGIVFFMQRLRETREALRKLAAQYAIAIDASRESEARYRTLFDSIDEGFCIIEVLFDENSKPLDYRFIETNASFEKHTGLLNATGRTISELAPNHEPYWFQTYGQIALTGEPARFQNRAEQLQRWYDVYAFRIGLPEQHRVAVLFNDISARLEAEEALQESGVRFRAIYQHAPVGIEQVALDGRLLMVNATQCEMLGYSESELLAKTFEDITYPEDRAAEAVLLKRLLRGEQESYNLEKRYLRKNGEPVWVNITSTAVRSSSGVPQYRITVVEDITIRKRAERALVNAEKLSVAGRMASSMAHEINNPLGAALNLLYLISLDGSLSTSNSEYLNSAQRELERVAHLAKQTLGFYRETGSPTKVDLREVADDVVNLYMPKLKNKDVQIERRYWTEAPIYGVEGELRQILSNLLINSIDAVSTQGCVRLRVSGPSTLDGDRPVIRLSVSDNGSGIKPQHLKQIFEPFFSTKETTGTGLGLWVTQQLVKKHDGTIRVRSKPGMGTVVQVYLPVERRTLERLTQQHADEGINAAA
jgi:PAS domain S-box-containing protein